MTITQRTLRPFRTQATNDRIPPDEYLDGLVVNSMLGILHQLGQLSEFASEVFQSLYQVAQQTGTRVSKLSGRIQSLEQPVASAEQMFESTAPSVFYSNSKASSYRRTDNLTDSLFNPNTQPVAMKKARAEARAPPPLQLLDAHTQEPALKKFSNPMYFLEQWLEAEHERQNLMQEERKKRGGKKKAKDQKPKRMLVKAEAVEVKKFSAQGKEFADMGDTGAVARGPIMRPQLQTQNAAQQQQQAQQQETAPLPPVMRPSMAPSHNAPPPQVPDHAPPVSRGGPPPPPPPMFAAQNAPPVPPPVPGMGGPPPPPPMMVQQAPVFIPQAPPLLDDAPLLNASFNGHEVDSGEAEADQGDADGAPQGGDMFAAIRAGAMKNLKKVDVQVERRNSGRGGLLSEIRNKNFQLKKVEQTKPAAPAAAGGGMTSIMSILARRAAIQGSDDEDEDDDDWED